MKSDLQLMKSQSGKSDTRINLSYETILFEDDRKLNSTDMVFPRIEESMSDFCSSAVPSKVNIIIATVVALKNDVYENHIIIF